MAKTYIDDNFGVWSDMDDPEAVAFYHRTQKESVWKKCQHCKRRVKLRPDYVICNACAEKVEQGLDI